MEQSEIVGQLEKRIAVFLVPCVELPHEVTADEFFKSLLEGAAVGDARFLDKFFIDNYNARAKNIPNTVIILFNIELNYMVGD